MNHSSHTRLEIERLAVDTICADSWRGNQGSKSKGFGAFFATRLRTLAGGKAKSVPYAIRDYEYVLSGSTTPDSVAEEHRDLCKETRQGELALPELRRIRKPAGSSDPGAEQAWARQSRKVIVVTIIESRKQQNLIFTDRAEKIQMLYWLSRDPHGRSSKDF